MRFDLVRLIQASSPLDSLSSIADFAFRNIKTAMTDDMVRINYETVNEAQNAFYLLEYAIDGQQFETLTGIKDAMGMPAYQYELQDQNPKFGSGYYRIKYVETNGNYQYSESIPVLFKQATTPHLIVHPNPFIDEMTINFIEPLAQDAQIMISNSLGKIMETCFVKEGANRLTIDCPNYPSGFYTVYVKVKGRRGIVYRMLKVE
ncbi:MAG: T9SS type A sorting domain-containing protein [Saprospiraceae bacterium]